MILDIIHVYFIPKDTAPYKITIIKNGYQILHIRNGPIQSAAPSTDSFTRTHSTNDVQLNLVI